MIAICFMKWWLGEIWFYEIDNIFDYVFRIIESAFGIIPTILLLLIDLILSPIEIIAVIIYLKKYKGKKSNGTYI